MDKTNTLREIDKIGDVLFLVVQHLNDRDKSNAALHMSDTVRNAPLTVAVDGAYSDLMGLRAAIHNDTTNV